MYKNSLYLPAMTMMSYPTSSLWKDLCLNVKQEDLDDAYSQMNKLEEIFEDVGELKPRRKKNMERVKAKIEQIEKRDRQYFKAVSDFTAFRINCDVTSIDDKVHKIAEIVSSYKGTMWFKGNCKDKDDKYADIIQYIYVYIPEIGHITEFQIGSSFASYVFTIDSEIRDNPDCGKIDLWANNTYNIVKKYILNKVNGSDDIYPSRKDAWGKVFDLFKKVEVPEELRKVLRELP